MAFNPEAPFDEGATRNPPPPPNGGWWIMVLLVLSIVVVLLGMMVYAFAHEAPSGWRYPEDCCADGDCHPVSCEALREVEGGIAFLNFKFTKEMIRNSKDGFCHVCIGHYGPGAANAKPHCLFMTPRT